MSFFQSEVKKEKSLIGFKDFNKSLTRRKDQTGKTNKARDIVRKSMPPGKRISRSGSVYYEARQNRSDLFGEKI